MNALIQPFGFHVGFSDHLRVVSASANLSTFVEGLTADSLLDQPMTSLASDDAIHEIRNRMALLRPDAASDHLFGCSLREGGPAFDISVRRQGDGFAIDAEPAVRTGGDAVGILAAQLDRIIPCTDLAELAKRAADEFRALTGADRVAVFLAGCEPVSSGRAGHGVKAPECAPPAAATIVDTEAEPVGVQSRSQVHLGASEFIQGDELTLSWLTSLGARSGLLIDLPDWMGAIACLHATPRQIALERRCIGRILARLVGMQTRIIRNED